MTKTMSENQSTPDKNFRRDNLKYIIPGVACLVYLILAISTAPHYGITWDEAEGDWYNAERNLNYLLSFDGAWLDFSQDAQFPPSTIHPRFLAYTPPWVTLYFGNLLSAIGCKIFFTKLGLMGAIEAHHMPNFLLVAGVLAAMFFLMREKFGLLPAIISLFTIAFQPRFWADTHFNTKDLPYACIMAFTLLAARKSIISRRAGWMVITSVLLGLSASTKLNAFLIPVIVVVWFLTSYREIKQTCEPYSNERQGACKIYFIASLVLCPFIAFAVFIMVWPYLWFDTVARLQRFLEHYFVLAAQGSPGIQWDTLALFFSVQPPALLIFGTIGVGMALYNIIKSKNREISSFLLIWFALPVLRMLMPRMYNFDGVRHFIEYAVPFGAFAGLGAAESVKWIKTRIEKFSARPEFLGIAAAATIVAAPFFAWSYTMIRIHPNEVAYFNFLVGGLPGARARWKDATDYWGSSLRQGIKWLNDNAERNAVVVVPVGGYIVASEKDMFMRKDLRLFIIEMGDEINQYDLVNSISEDRPTTIYAMYVTRTGWYNNLAREIDSNWTLLYTINVDNTPILKILKSNISPQPPPVAPQQ